MANPGGFTITVRYDGTAIKKALDEMERRGVRQRPVWKRAGEILRTSTDDTFVSQGRPERWEALSANTVYERAGGRSAYTKGGRTKTGKRIKVRMRKGTAEKIKGLQILQRTGRLRRSIGYKSDEHHVEMGTNLVYAAIHQFGGEAGRKNARVTIPKRPYLVVQDEDLAEVEATMLEYLLAAFPR